MGTRVCSRVQALGRLTRVCVCFRYRCLEAIVKGAFPNEAISTAPELVQLGRRLGYTMPAIDDASQSSLKIEELLRDPATAHTASTESTEPSGHTITLPQRGTETPNPRTRSSSEEPHVSLIRDTSGNEHYIGPSGTLSFLSQLRKLVDTNQAAAEAADPAGAIKFTKDNTAQALEADQQQEEANDDQTGQTADSIPGDGLSPGSITSVIARDFTRLPTADMDEILRQFPPDDILELLIHSYFKNVHDDFPLFHRATFEDEYELFVVQARSRPQIARRGQRPFPDWGWIGCLHMMVVFGSIANPKIPAVDHTALRRRSVTAARTLLPQFISKCTLTNVRVLLLLSLFLHNNNERNAAWNLVGTATRISFALGLHRSDMSSSFRPLEREVRKWVFCTLYSFEQFLASSLGRPSGLQEVDVEITPPREGFLDGGNGTDAKLVSLSLKLQGILSKTRLMHLAKRKTDLATPPPSVDEILSALDRWKQSIAQQPGFDLPWIKSHDSPYPETPGAMDLEELKASLAWKTRAQVRSVLLLHIQFHYIAIVATRPILLRDIAMLRKAEGRGGSRPGGLSAHADTCVKSASQLAFIILLLDSFDILNGLSGLDVFYAYCAAMALILRLLRSPRDAAVPDQSEAAWFAEEQTQASIRTLVGKVQVVINRADKGGSMRRFARVVDTFAECINRPTPPRRNPNTGAHPMQQQPHPQGGMRMDGTQMYDQNMAMGALPPDHQMQLMPGQQFGEASGLDGLLDFLPLSTFGNTGLNNGPFAQFTGNNGDMAMPEWSDVDLLLAGYGVQ